MNRFHKDAYGFTILTLVAFLVLSLAMALTCIDMGWSKWLLLLSIGTFGGSAWLLAALFLED